MVTADTIYALSSGSPPAAVALVRISGPKALKALEELSGRAAVPRRASLQTLRDPASAEVLDRAITLFFPGPATATGEDVAELHLHGGRAVVQGVLDVLAGMSGLRSAEPGEFTRRAFENGRMDLAEVEGLGDLLVAETQSQRRAALALAGGALSRKMAAWQDQILHLAAALEVLIDYSDEGDVAGELPGSWTQSLAELTRQIEQDLRAPPAERLRDGIRVVLAGPPNAGKSSLFNCIVGRAAAITSPIAGTTRDLIEAPVAIAGIPFVFIDTAGLRDSDEDVEAQGIALARHSLQAADIVLWLGRPDDPTRPDHAVVVVSKSDLLAADDRPVADAAVSARTLEGIDNLVALLIDKAWSLLPQEGEVAINARHRGILAATLMDLAAAQAATDLLIKAEHLRLSRMSLDRITGRAGVEEMLDRLFTSFCIGK